MSVDGQDTSVDGPSTSVYGPGGLGAGQPSGGAKRRRSANFEKLLSNFEAGPDTRMVQVANPEESRVKVVEATARVKVWDRKDDETVRRIAARNVGRRWSLLKVCGSVVDEISEIVDELPLKDKLKEKLWWKGEERKKFTEWKNRNIKFLNLKESERKEVAKVKGPLGDYFKPKYLDRKKFEVEEMLEKENSKLEEDLKEIIEERKAAKSKKRKLVIFRKCKRKLEELILNWNETKDMEEDRRAKVIKEAAMEERLKETLTLKQRKAENDYPPEAKPLSSTKEADRLQPEANPFVAAVTADLGCDNGPSIPSSARFGQRMTKFK